MTLIHNLFRGTVVDTVFYFVLISISSESHYTFIVEGEGALVFSAHFFDFYQNLF